MGSEEPWYQPPERQHLAGLRGGIKYFGGDQARSGSRRPSRCSPAKLVEPTIRGICVRSNKGSGPVTAGLQSEHPNGVFPCPAAQSILDVQKCAVPLAREGAATCPANQALHRPATTRPRPLPFLDNGACCRRAATSWRPPSRSHDAPKVGLIVTGSLVAGFAASVILPFLPVHTVDVDFATAMVLFGCGPSGGALGSAL